MPIKQGARRRETRRGTKTQYSPILANSPKIKIHEEREAEKNFIHFTLDFIGRNEFSP